MPLSSPERLRDSNPVLNRLMLPVEKYQLLEKGVLSQEELDHLLDSPIEYRPDDKAMLTKYKILRADDPSLTLDDLEEADDRPPKGYNQAGEEVDENEEPKPDKSE